MVTSGQDSEVYELALAYRNAVQRQYEWIRTAYKRREDEKLFFYSVYHQIQRRLKSIETSICTVNNPGGPVYILNNSNSLSFNYEGFNGQLYYELVNGSLHIKFHIDAPDEVKYKLRDKLRKAIKDVYGADYKIVNSGRLGKYMTASKIEYDFTDIENFEKSASVFSNVGSKLGEVLKRIS